MPPNVRRRNPASERAVLDATLALMKEGGLAALTIEGIAARAGVGKQTVYRWWPSKGAVAMDALLDAAAPDIVFADTGDLLGDLGAILEQVLALLADPQLGHHFVACLMESQRDPDLALRFDERVFGPIRGTYRQRLRLAQQHGTLRSDVDLDDVLDLAFGAIWLRAATRPGQLRPGLGRRLAGLVLHGAGSAAAVATAS